jgi:hypothetical protein
MSAQISQSRDFSSHKRTPSSSMIKVKGGINMSPPPKQTLQCIQSINDVFAAIHNQ